MSLLLQAAEFRPEPDGDTSSKSKSGESRISRVLDRISNRKSTPKRPPPDFERPQQVSEPMTNITPIDDSDDTELGNFNHAPPAVSPSVPIQSSVGRAKYPDVGDGGYASNSSSGFPGELDDAYARNIGFRSTGGDSDAASHAASHALHSNDTIKKLDYLIHMIEEQRDHKTGRVAEELVLYSFLGVFIIFTIDSFVKVGKYTR